MSIALNNTTIRIMFGKRSSTQKGYDIDGNVLFEIDTSMQLQSYPPQYNVTIHNVNGTTTRTYVQCHNTDSLYKTHNATSIQPDKWETIKVFDKEGNFVMQHSCCLLPPLNTHYDVTMYGKTGNIESHTWKTAMELYEIYKSLKIVNIPKDIVNVVEKNMFEKTKNLDTAKTHWQYE